MTRLVYHDAKDRPAVRSGFFKVIVDTGGIGEQTSDGDHFLVVGPVDDEDTGVSNVRAPSSINMPMSVAR